MSVKCDTWIRKMALEREMIRPFEANQVKELGDKKVISYGTSSYGYDVRCAREFKIFTNINSSTVDPKNFDPASFVDFEGDVCIIPPNSFALARTVEHFKLVQKRRRQRLSKHFLRNQVHTRWLNWLTFKRITLQKAA